jgi:hypothetical protein
MADFVVDAVAGVTRTWREEAEKRRGISKVDPIADTLDYCAGEIAARLKTIEASSQRLTVEQYAARVKRTPQTIRNWIRNGQLAAIATTKGYEISVDAERVRRSA